MSPEAPGPGDREDPTREADQLHGHYANYFEIGQNAAEFVLDFGQAYTERTKGRLHTRIITSPAYALDFLRLLQQSIDEYRRAFGDPRVRAEVRVSSVDDVPDKENTSDS